MNMTAGLTIWGPFHRSDFFCTSQAAAGLLRAHACVTSLLYDLMSETCLYSTITTMHDTAGEDGKQCPLMVLTDDQDVVQLLHAVNLRQELVDHSVVHARAAGARASLLADGIQLIKDDDMETTVGSELETGPV